MLVKDAKEVARQWVIDEASSVPGFYGAYYAGSTTWLADNVVLPATSDLDIMVVLDDPTPKDKIGKFIYQNVLLEVTYLPREQVQSPDVVLGHYHLAGSFRRPNVILDPSGQLTKLQREVSKGFVQRTWVYRRCEQARDTVIKRLQGLNSPAPFHEQVTAWLFAAGGLPHVLLVAGLQNPTVRRRYVAARELLEGYGRLDFYESLLELLGCAQMSRARVENQLPALSEVFDVAKAVIETPFSFAADISDMARPVAIEGSRELIECGYHREAIFWMVATYSRCQMVLSHDAPVALQDRFSHGYRQLLSELGIASAADLQQRGEQIQAFLPQLWDVTEAILAANPEIED
jgi:hypothetical protein